MKIAMENNVENWNRQHKKKTPIENLLFLFISHESIDLTDYNFLLSAMSFVNTNSTLALPQSIIMYS